MIAKVIKTGEIVDVEECGYDSNFYNTKVFCDKSGNRYLLYDLEFDVKEQTKPTKEIDWEQRRFELAKAIMPTLVQNLYDDDEPKVCKWSKLSAKRAVECADALIEELRNK